MKESQKATAVLQINVRCGQHARDSLYAPAAEFAPLLTSKLRKANYQQQETDH